MNLKQLKNNELHDQFIKLSKKERKLSLENLKFISEIEHRKLHHELAFGTMFDYLTCNAGYSIVEAKRRLDAAKLLNDFPDIGRKVESGILNLAQLSLLQKAFRKAKKLTGQPVDISVKRNFLLQVEGKSTLETKEFLAKAFNYQVVEDDKMQIQKDGSIRLHMTFSKKEMDLLYEALNALGNNMKQGKNGIKLRLKDLALYSAYQALSEPKSA